MSGACGTQWGEGRTCVQFLMKKPEEILPLRRRIHVWENDIKMDIEEISLQDVNSIDLDQSKDKWRAVVNAAMNLQVPKMLFKKKKKNLLDEVIGSTAQ
jgi:hypothetical protein